MTLGLKVEADGVECPRNMEFLIPALLACSFSGLPGPEMYDNSQSSNLAMKTDVTSEDVLVKPGNSKTTPSGRIREKRKSRSFNFEERSEPSKPATWLTFVTR